MPFTPLHLGIGTICKATSKHRFSFMIFGGTQVMMDIEPLLGMLLGWPTLHLFTHNLFSAISIAIISVLIGKPMSEFILKRLGYIHWQISWRVALISAFVGTFSHILLDAFMHFDMYPFFPITLENPLFGLTSVPAIHLFSIASFIIAGAFCLFKHRYHLLFTQKS